MRKILVTPFIGLIYIYKYMISPLLPRGCRHFPSCSTYSIDALKMHGIFRGGFLAADRIARCRPWGTSGYDPVPRFLFKKINIRKLGFDNRMNFPACDRLKHH
jgi:putative membrane protein insertion efficiency factor